MKRFLTLLIIALSLVLINHSCKPKEEELGSIYGIVTDKATGEPVKTAGVELSPLGLKTVTGSEGQFEFTELEAGDYKLFVTKTGYVELVSNTIVVKSAQTAKGDIQIEKLPPALKVVNDNGDEINELDFGEQYDDVSRMFSIFNDGPELLNYEIVKTAAWITSLSATEGSLEPGATKPIVVNIDRAMLQVGENTTTINVTSNNGSKQLTIHVEKLPAALSVVDNENKSIDELDFGNNLTETSRTFYLYNNAKPSLNYQITKDVEWISSISSTQGTIEGNTKVSIVVLINRDKLSIGENITTLNIQSDNGGKQLTVKANKLAPELMLVDDNGKEITEVNYGSNFDNLSRSFNVFNNGTIPLDYQVNESADWLEITNKGGTIQGGVKVPITITIDLHKLAVGENSTIINVTSEYGNKQLTVKANKLAPELVILNDEGNVIKEIDYASNFDNLSRQFNLMNNGVFSLNYQISKSVDWLTLSNESGSLNSKETKPIFITIDINKLPIGENSTLLNISSEYGNKQLTVKANKLAPELVILNDAGNEISEIDYASNFDNLSRTFNIKNNGVVGVDYQITKSVDWLTLSNESGSLNSKETKPIFITIDINKLPIGENSTLLNISSEYGNKQLTVKANKLAPELVILNDAGDEITEIDYASNFDNLSRQFNIRNNGIVALNYQIIKTVDWLTINNTEGMLQAGAMSSVVITIDINKLPVGNNTAMLSINSEYGNKQLVVKANKLAPELVILNDAGDEITEIDYASNFDNLSRQFNIRNNGIVALNYQIIKTVDWLTINNTEGMLQAGAMSSVVITIDINKLPVGNNTAMLSINSEYGNKQLAVKANKLAPELVILNDAGNEISEIDYASNFDNLSRSFNIKNNGIVSLNYQITKTVDWLTINNVEGTLQAGATKQIIITVDVDKLPIGDNSTLIHISSEYGNKQLTVKANKLAPELMVSTTSLDFGNGSTSSLSFTITNNSYSVVDYAITKTANWISSISNMEGSLLPNATQNIVVTINRNEMPLGNSDAIILVTSNIGNKQIDVICTINGSIITNAATDVDHTSVVLNGKLEGDFSYSEKGFYFGTDVNCTTKYSVSGSGSGTFSYYVSGLEEGVTYYFKSYVIRNNTTIFGDVKSFTTLTYNGHEYVDLALPSGLKWATCNSGAGSPEEYGNYLNFGEAEDATWGGNWRCPTKSEWEELKSNCAWTWTTKDGVNGYEVVGSNGNSIFLPAAGYRNGSLYDVGSWGYYWTSTPNGSNYAYYFYFNSSGQNMNYNYPSNGRSVRLVAE